METREETRARLRDLIGAKKLKRNMPPHVVNLHHVSQVGDLMKCERDEYLITQANIRQAGGEMLNMGGPRLHT